MDTPPPSPTPAAPAAPGDFVFATTEAEARPHVERLASLPLVALDTETFHVPEEDRWKLSLVQVSGGSGPVLMVDALAFAPEVLAPLLAPLVERPTCLKAAHAARYDVTALAGAGLKPQGFVDTLRLAQWSVWLPAYGLADLIRELFGVELDKRWQKSDWKQRPLLDEQLAYAAADARWTLRMAEVLRAKLQESGRWTTALEHATLTDAKAAAAPKAKKKAAGPPEPEPAPLTPAQEVLLQALRGWRLEAAKAARLPAYMVLHDRALEQLARERPTTMAALATVKGLGESKLQRYGQALLSTLSRAAAAAAAAAASS